MRNRGLEMSLHTINLTGELGWETNVTATYNKNKIKDLNSAVPYYINQINNSYVTMLAKDYPINALLRLRNGQLIPKPGGSEWHGRGARTG